MTAVSQVHQWLLEAGSSSKKALEMEFSRPWSWAQVEGGPKRVPNHDAPHGVYILSEPAEADWRVAMSENRQPVWYVGQTSRSFQDRVYDRLAGSGGVPKDGGVWEGWEEWDDDRIRQVMRQGGAVVYTVPVQLDGWPEDLPLVLEKYLLSRIYLRDGDYPPLNQTIKS